MGEYILAHDLGTSGNKATLFRTDGKLECSFVSSYKTYQPKAGWAEQDPNDWWQAVISSTRKLMEGKRPEELAGISFSGQMMGCVCLGGDGRTLMNSIIWADTRADKENRHLLREIGLERACRLIGQRLAPNFTLQKLMWLKENRPEIYKAAAVVFQAKDYILYKMTGTIVTEQTDAAYTQAYDISGRTWSEELLSAAGVRRDLFPEIRKSSDVIGGLTAEAAAVLGLCEGTPVVAGAGDGPCATVGAGSIKTGDGYVCLGSSCWVSNNTTIFQPDPECRIQYSPHVVDGLYMAAGTMQTGGLAYNWAKDRLYEENCSYEEINQDVKRAPAGADGVLFLPYLMGERAPWWNAQARGLYAGLSLSTTKQDMIRAVVEGVVMNLALILEEIEKAEKAKRMTVIGGGARGGSWNQVLADVFGMEIMKPCEVEEASSFGAAVIAGVGLGIYPDYTVADRLVKPDICYLPDRKNHELYGKQLKRFRELYLRVEPLFRG